MLVLPQPEAGDMVAGQCREIMIGLTKQGRLRIPAETAVAVYARGIRFGRRLQDPHQFFGFVGAAVMIPTGQRDGGQVCQVAYARVGLIPGIVRGGWFVYTRVPPEIEDLLDEIAFEAGL